MVPPIRVLAVLVLAASVVLSACREDGGVKVARLSFDGNQAFDDSVLSGVVVTQASGMLPWARSRYFNRATFDADLERLRAFYRDRGYPSASVEAVDIAFNDARDEVAITIAIAEGRPTVVEQIEFSGLDAVSTDVARAVADVPLQAGEPLDRFAVGQGREQVAFALRDRGYPDAQVDVVERPGQDPANVILTFTVEPGELATFGTVETAGLRRVEQKVVDRTLAFKPGDMFRESLLLESQRRLIALGTFQFAHVGRAPDEADTEPTGERAAPPADAADSAPVRDGLAPASGTVPVTVTVAEAKMTRARLGIGYGSEDGPRGSLTWQHANFLGAARRLSTDAKYSQRLRGVGIDLGQPYLFSRNVSIRAHLGATWTQDLDYSSRRLGGRVTFEFQRVASRGLDRAPRENVLRVSYNNEALKYGIRPQTLEDLTQFDELIALGFDPVTGEGSGRIASVDLDLEHSALDRALDARQGYALALHLEGALPAFGGTYRFTELTSEARGYLPVGGSVIAGRVRAGALLARDAADVPFSARYFLGGSSSLRGWGRYEVAPLTADGLPIGGRGTFETSAEWRMRLVGNFGLVAFVDAGNVWPDRSQIKLSDLRADVGTGLRWTSPVGVVRADLGYQLTRIEGLVLNGQPERRPWRIHFSIGEAF